MIRNIWYGIMDSKEVIKGKPVGVTRLGEKLVLWRNSDGSVSCIYDKCCHRGASLACGWVEDDHIRCPFHGFKYDYSGKVVMIPANGKNAPVPERYKVNSFAVEDKYGIIWLWYGDPLAKKYEIPFFEDLRQGFSYGGFSEVWPVHYTRAVENQLDVVHLPFVHTDTIGRGNRTLVNGPVVEWDDERMTFYVNNEVDDGSTVPLKPEQIKNYKQFFSLAFQMPNIWQNFISKDLRIVAVFAPIDENNTRIYLRTYQRFVTIPILREVVSSLMGLFNKKILHQDRDVVITQLPVKTELAMGEKLIQGDLPIIEFRKRRDALKNKSNQEL